MLMLLLAVLSMIISGVTSVPAAYTHFEGVGYYKLNTTYSKWADAWLDCYNDNAKLLVINSEREREAIISIVHDSTLPDEYAWLGVHTLFNTEERIFVTVTDERLETVPFMVWHEDEPSNTNGNENCVVFNNATQLIDTPCDSYYPHMCEL